MSWRTPGPWRANAHGTSVTAPETEDALALNVRIVGGNPKVNKANARLIAAAPDMLEVLQAFVKEQADHQGLVSIGTYEAACKVLEKVKGAPL